MSDGSMQAAGQAQPIIRELSIGEILSRTFDIYRRNFVKFVIIYIIVEAILGVATELATRSISIVAPTVGSTTVANLSALLGNVFLLLGIIFLLAIIFAPIEVGIAIKMTADDIEKGQVNLVESVKFMVRRIVWFWVASIIVGVIVLIGSFLLFVPGIILAIMFSMVPSVIVIEKIGPLASLGRSHALVSRRWLKTFALAIVVAVIVIIPIVILDLISRLAGAASGVVGDVLSGLVLPIVPIALTVYYYSNVARTAPPPTTPSMFFGSIPAPGVRYCPNCGTQLPATATFCPNCGAKLNA